MPPGVDPNSRFVFAGNLAWDVTEQQMIDVFSKAGQVKAFRLVFDQASGKPKGYGFCEYYDHDSAASACRNLNGFMVLNRPLRIDLAEPQPGKGGSAPGGGGQGANKGNRMPQRQEQPMQQPMYQQQYPPQHQQQASQGPYGQMQYQAQPYGQQPQPPIQGMHQIQTQPYGATQPAFPAYGAPYGHQQHQPNGQPMGHPYPAPPPQSTTPVGYAGYGNPQDPMQQARQPTPLAGPPYMQQQQQAMDPYRQGVPPQQGMYPYQQPQPPTRETTPSLRSQTPVHAIPQHHQQHHQPAVQRSTTPAQMMGQKMPQQGVNATDAVSQVLSTMSPAQLLEVLSQIKNMSQTQPEQARQILTASPQLAYALFQVMLMMNIVDPAVLQQMIASTAPTTSPSTTTTVTTTAAAAGPAVETEKKPEMTSPASALATKLPSSIALSPDAEAKLAALPSAQKAMLMQVLTLTPQQVEAAPAEHKPYMLAVRQQFGLT